MVTQSNRCKQKVDIAIDQIPGIGAMFNMLNAIQLPRLDRISQMYTYLEVAASNFPYIFIP